MVLKDGENRQLESLDFPGWDPAIHPSASGPTWGVEWRQCRPKPRMQPCVLCASTSASTMTGQVSVLSQPRLADAWRQCRLHPAHSSFPFPGQQSRAISTWILEPVPVAPTFALLAWQALAGSAQRHNYFMATVPPDLESNRDAVGQARLPNLPQ